MTKNLSYEKEIYRSTTRRYLLAVLIIALLSTSAYYTLQSALSDSDATAYIVNLSGKQRMLSQHIALDAHRFKQTYRADNPPIDEHLSLLTQNISAMRQANRQLSSGILSENKFVDLSTPIRKMYFGEMDLYARVNSYLDIAQKLHSSISDEDRLRYVNLIDSQSEQLLKDLNKAVQQYQLEGEERLSTIEDLELFVWVATITALLLEVLLIFRPMAKLIVMSQQAQEHTLEKLEEMVELRTLKLEMANKKLKQMATHDPLTKLKNRLTLESDVEALINVSETNHVPFALAVIDIDFFKKVNDGYGHPAGDYVLKELSAP
jgi:two-component system cell cycle response regulator